MKCKSSTCGLKKDNKCLKYAFCRITLIQAQDSNSLSQALFYVSPTHIFKVIVLIEEVLVTTLNNQRRFRFSTCRLGLINRVFTVYVALLPFSLVVRGGWNESLEYVKIAQQNRTNYIFSKLHGGYRVCRILPLVYKFALQIHDRFITKN